MLVHCFRQNLQDEIDPRLLGGEKFQVFPQDNLAVSIHVFLLLFLEQIVKVVTIAEDLGVRGSRRFYVRDHCRIGNS